MKKKIYYILEVDNYGQPSGAILEVELTKKEYEKLCNTRGYVFNNYYSALARAQD